MQNIFIILIALLLAAAIALVFLAAVGIVIFLIIKNCKKRSNINNTDFNQTWK